MNDGHFIANNLTIQNITTNAFQPKTCIECNRGTIYLKNSNYNISNSKFDNCSANTGGILHSKGLFSYADDQNIGVYLIENSEFT